MANMPECLEAAIKIARAVARDYLALEAHRWIELALSDGGNVRPSSPSSWDADLRLLNAAELEASGKVSERFLAALLERLAKPEVVDRLVATSIAAWSLQEGARVTAYEVAGDELVNEQAERLAFEWWP